MNRRISLVRSRIQSLLRIASVASLRARITWGFVLIVVFGAAVATYLGSRIVTHVMYRETLKRVGTGLQAARTMVQAELDQLRLVVVLVASRDEIVHGAGRAQEEGGVQDPLGEWKVRLGLDLLGYVDREHWKEPAQGGEKASAYSRLPASVEAAESGEVVASTEILDAETSPTEDPSMGGNPGRSLSPIPQRKPLPATHPGDGSRLVLIAAAPVRGEKGVVGIVYGGRVLDGKASLVNRINRTVFGGETYGGEDVGVVSIFLGDRLLATSLASPPGERGVQAAFIPAEVTDSVLRRGETWSGRAFAVDDWYVAVYEPIRDHDQRTVGMLCVGIKEGPYLSVRNSMMLSFLVLVVIGVVLVLGFTFLITHTMLRPLEEVVAASKRIAGGDLDHGVQVASRDEIGHLASSFNTMLASLKTMRHQLQESHRTLEDKVRERTEQLVAVQAQMIQSEKLASLGRMSAGVAHEINNPLGGILTFAMLALEECGPDHPLRKNLDIIVKQTLRCRDIVRGLLDFARQSKGEAATMTDANAVIENTLSLLEKQTIFQNLRVVRQLSAELPQVLIDPGQLQQVVMNLVLNAVDAMEEGGTLTLETGLDPATGEVLIRVVDTGKGIPPEILPLVFEPFFTTKEVGKGTGLGLAVVHGIVGRTGGSIDVTSRRGATTFTVRLPAY